MLRSGYSSSSSGVGGGGGGGGTRTRLNRYASDASDKSSPSAAADSSTSTSTTSPLNGTGSPASPAANTNNSSSTTSVGRSESFGSTGGAGYSVTDGATFSSHRLSLRGDAGAGGVAGGSSLSTGRFSSYTDHHHLPTLLSSSKRDAFFKSGSGGSGGGSDMSNGPSKYDPSHRAASRDSHEREKSSLGNATTTNHTAAATRDHHHHHNHNQHNNHSSSATSAAAAAPSASAHSQVKHVDGYVGFANLPNQVYRRAVKKGFEFTLMVVGESGLGKSTLINSMFLADIYCSEYPGPSQRIKKTVQVETNQCVLKENGVQLSLTVVDTPGFGDAVDNSNCWQPIIDSVEKRYDEYLNAESRVSRKSTPDKRVHCCLYFISPNGHGLKPLDVEFMRRLHDKVNIIPVIAKADTMTPEECRDFKKTILNEIAQHKIKIYEFPDSEDEEDRKIQKKLRDRVPFAVIGSNTMVESHGKRVRGRVYPWGVVEVENLEHNDFIALRNMVIRTHMQDLKDITNNVHYENFRYKKLAAVTSNGKVTGNVASNTKNPLAQMEEEKKEHVIKMKKMEAEMEQVFEMKVKEKKQKLKDSELELERRAEQMRRNLDQQQKELDEKRKILEQESRSWEESQRVLEEQRRTLENVKDTMNKKKKSLFN